MTLEQAEAILEQKAPKKKAAPKKKSNSDQENSG
jgi:hypothetical protein